MIRTRIILAAAVSTAALFAVAATAHEHMKPDVSDPVSLRMTLMKHTGAAMKTLGAMAKGEMPYDAALAEASFRAMNAAAVGFPAQFPEGSEGGESEAGPKIWAEPEAFEAVAAKFIADTYAAVEAKPADLDAFKPVFGQVAANCKACHQDYRVKK